MLAIVNDIVVKVTRELRDIGSKLDRTNALLDELLTRVRDDA